MKLSTVQEVFLLPQLPLAPSYTLSAVRIGTAVCPHHSQASESPQSLLQLCAPVMRMLGDTDRRLRFYLCEPAYYASRVYEGASLKRVHGHAGNPHIERRRMTSAQGEVRVPEWQQKRFKKVGNKKKVPPRRHRAV